MVVLPAPRLFGPVTTVVPETGNVAISGVMLLKYSHLVAKAVADIRDGDTLLVGSVGLVGFQKS